MNTNLYLLIISAVLASGIAAGVWAILVIEKKIRVLFGNGSAEETDFQKNLVRRLARAEAKLEELEPRVSVLETVSKTSVQKIGFLRFNPFQDTGGDQSFILVMLDRDNNGLLLSSLYAREGVRVYAKNIERGKSKYPLSEEEKRVLEETVNK